MTRRHSCSKILKVRSLCRGFIFIFSIMWLGAAVLIASMGQGIHRWSSSTSLVAATRDAGPVFLAIFTVFLSGVSFLMYGYDKMVARIGSGGAFRISEATLHAVSLAGGWPGSVLAQQVFRHKRSKATFQREFMVIVVGNILLVGILAKLFDFSLLHYLWRTSNGTQSVQLFGFDGSAPSQRSEEL